MQRSMPLVVSFLVSFAFSGLFSTAIAAAQEKDFEFLPGTRYDPAIPTLKKVLGYAPAERMSNHAEVEKYVRALAAASDKVNLHKHGESWEGRALYHLVISSPANLALLSDIQAGLRRLADPRKLSDADAETLLDDLPSIAWLGYSVHGDEVSCTDAGLMLAYHLAAAQNDKVAAAILENSVVILDPLLNPDGRERFVFHYRQTRGRWPDAEPVAAEHNQPWPGGRTNHYLFDMNRDWFAGTQPETRARNALFQKWWPQVFVDVHTMGSNSTYYFPPPAKAHNPEITKKQHEWLERYGRNNARWFDRFGFDYFVRESFDAFYPGYGEGWPTFHGAIGMTFEQASVRGLKIRRDDDTTLLFRDAVHHHFIASLATAETCATNRRAVLEAFLDYRRSAITEGSSAKIKEYLLPPGRDPQRTLKLADRLVAQGVEVHRATGPLKCAAAADLRGGEPKERTFPAGTFVVRLAQPAKRLANVLLGRHFDMEKDFLEEQKKKHEKRKRAGFYDLTAWSLPLLFDVECFAVHDNPATGRVDPYGGSRKRELVSIPRAKVAYLVPWGTNEAAAFLAGLQRKGVRVHCAGKAFTIDTKTYPAGSLIIKVKGNGDPAKLNTTLAGVATEHPVAVNAVNSSWVDKGINFGSNEVRFLERPKILLLWDRPVSGNSAGHARFVLEQQYGYPVTLVRARQLASADLRRFNVVVLPSGRYGKQLAGAVSKLKAWLASGGTIITIGGATPWLASKDVGLLAAASEDRQKPSAQKPGAQKPGAEKPDAKKPDAKKKDGDEKKPEPFDYDKAIQPDKERPARTTGAILSVNLDKEHWLAFGYDGDCNAISTTSAIFTPVKIDKGTNVGVYAPRDKLLLSGFAFDDKLDQLAGKAWLIHQPVGRGHVVAFTEDPNYRAFVDGLNLLFLNAVMFGPGF